MRSEMIDLDGPVHYADYGGEGPPMVLVHGLGGSHLNWMRVGPSLAEHAHVYAIDLAGFGRTPPAGRSTDVRANRALLDRFIAHVGGRAIVVGNSMGGLISATQASLRPDSVSRLILVDPALPRTAGHRPDAIVVAMFAAYAVPMVGERFVAERAKRLGAEGMVRETMRMCNADVSRVPKDVIDAHVRFAQERMDTMPWSAKSFLAAARSIVSVVAQKKQYNEMLRAIVSPTLVIHGDRDRLVPVGAARNLASIQPDWTIDVFEGVGHTPMIETPEAFVQSITRWMGSTSGERDSAAI